MNELHKDKVLVWDSQLILIGERMRKVKLPINGKLSILNITREKVLDMSKLSPLTTYSMCQRSPHTMLQTRLHVSTWHQTGVSWLAPMTEWRL